MGSTEPGLLRSIVRLRYASIVFDATRPSRPVARWLCLVSLVACSFGEVDLRELGCPCIDGWVCVSGVCVRTPGDGGADASAADASADSGLDAAVRDSATPDSGDSGGPDDGGVSDGSVPDGSAPGDAGIDADAGLATSACDGALSGTLFCDGFEALSLFPWEIGTAAGAEVARAVDPVYRGGGALGVELTVPGSRNANASTTFPSPVTTGPLAARLYLFIPSGESFDFLAFFSLTESQDPFGAVSVRLISGPSLSVQARVSETISTTRVSSTVLPTDQWLCLQVSVDVSPTAGAVSVLVDGVSLVAMTNLPTLPAQGYDSMVLGVNFSDPAQSPVELYLDEAAVDTSASLPCDP